MHGRHCFLLTALAAFLAGTAPAQPVTAGIDATRTAQPITKLVFGGFMEPALRLSGGTFCFGAKRNFALTGDIA